MGVAAAEGETPVRHRRRDGTVSGTLDAATKEAVVAAVAAGVFSSVGEAVDVFVTATINSKSVFEAAAATLPALPRGGRGTPRAAYGRVAPVISTGGKGRASDPHVNFAGIRDSTETSKPNHVTGYVGVSRKVSFAHAAKKAGVVPGRLLHAVAKAYFVLAADGTSEPVKNGFGKAFRLVRGRSTRAVRPPGPPEDAKKKKAAASDFVKTSIDDFDFVHGIYEKSEFGDESDPWWDREPVDFKAIGDFSTKE